MPAMLSAWQAFLYPGKCSTCGNMRVPTFLGVWHLARLMLVVGLLPGVGLCAEAQTRQYIFERLQGVFVQPATHTMDVDEYGRLWYGTWGRGVFVYDGYQYTRLQQEANNVNSLVNDRILVLKTDRRQRVWISTMNGLDCLDRRTGQIRHFGSMGDSIFQMMALYVDKGGVVWAAGARGVLRFNEVSGAFENISSATGAVPPARPNCFYEDAKGGLWMGRGDGLLRFSEDRSKFEFIRIGQAEAPAEPFRVIGMAESTDGHFLLAGYDGLQQFDPATGATRKVTGLPDSLVNGRVAAILPNSDGAFWLAMPEYGLFCWNPAGGQLQHFSHNVFDPTSLPSNQAHSLLNDRFGNLWVGTDKGIARLNLLSQPFSRWLLTPSNPALPSNDVVVVAQDPKGGILVRSRGGLYYLQHWGAEPIPLTARKHHPQFFEPDDFISDQDGNIWAIYDGLYRWEPERLTFSRVPTTLGMERIQACAQDTDEPHIWWLGTLRGLQRLDMRSGEVKAYDLPIAPGQARGIGKILDDRRGGVWAAGPAMLVRLDKQSGAITTYSAKTLPPRQIANDEVIDLDLSAEGCIWASTSSGLSRIQLGDGTVQNFSTREGLPDPLLLSSILDGQHNLWLVFPEHVLLRDARRGDFRVWNTAAILQTGQLARRAGWLLQDGALLLASRSGLVRVEPWQRTELRPPSIILLTKFETSNPKPMAGLEFLRHIQLANDQNNISIQWAGIQTARVDDLRYECKLEKKGEKRPWEQKALERQAVYANLAPGAYTFKVRLEGSESPELSIDIAIAPAWYQAESFKMLLMALFATAAYLFWRNREDNRELMQQKELAEQNARYKTRFLANMSHEIRTPMNAILGLSRLLTESKLPPKQSEYAEAIRQSSEHLLVIINDVLDQVKIESGKFTFQQKAFDLEWMVKHLGNTLGFKAEEKGLVFATRIAPGTPLRLIGDPVRLNQILTNLLGNAIKFTEKGRVELLIEAIEVPDDRSAVKIGFTVADTGIGIAPEQLPRVFESFQQADDDISAQYGGTGLGLSITKDLVEQQEGIITMESEPGVGTRILVVLSFFPDDSSENETVQETVRPYDFGALRILLVEDTFFNQMLAMELLQQRIPEAHMEVAENGQVALEKMASIGPFDLVLMDVKMPVMDGLEATRRIRSNPQWATLPIIALTANAVQEELEKCREAGMDAWVTKPIDAPELFATLERVMRGKRSDW